MKRLTYVALLAAGVAGCGQDARSREAAPPVAAEAQGDGGLAFDGTMLVLAGPRNDSLDLFRLRSGRPPERLTESVLGHGVSAFSARNGRVAMAVAPSGVDEIVVRRVGAKGLGRKRRIGFGHTPAIDGRGRVAYTRVRTVGGRPRTQLVVVRPGGRGRVVGVRGRPSSPAFGRGGALYASVLRRGRVRVRMVAPRSRKGDLLPATRGPGRILISRTGRLAYSGSGGLTTWDRSGRRRVVRTPWHPLTWSPDSRRLLASHEDGRLALMHPRTGAVQELGNPLGATVYAAEWMPGAGT